MINTTVNLPGYLRHTALFIGKHYALPSAQQQRHKQHIKTFSASAAENVISIMQREKCKKVKSSQGVFRGNLRLG